MDTDTGEFQEKRLAHREEAENFYLALAGKKVRVGMEASGHARWFEGVLSELQFELWIARLLERDCAGTGLRCLRDSFLEVRTRCVRVYLDVLSVA